MGPPRTISAAVVAPPSGRRGGRRALRGGGSPVQPPRSPTIWRARWGRSAPRRARASPSPSARASVRRFGARGARGPPYRPCSRRRYRGERGRVRRSFGRARRAVVETRTRRNGAGIGAGRNVPGLPVAPVGALVTAFLASVLLRGAVESASLGGLRRSREGRGEGTGQRASRRSNGTRRVPDRMDACRRFARTLAASRAPLADRGTARTCFCFFPPFATTENFSTVVARTRGEGRGWGSAPAGARHHAGKSSRPATAAVFPRADHSGKRAVRGASPLSISALVAAFTSPLYCFSIATTSSRGLAGDRRQRLDVVLSPYRVRPLRVSRSVLLLPFAAAAGNGLSFVRRPKVSPSDRAARSRLVRLARANTESRVSCLRPGGAATLSAAARGPASPRNKISAWTAVFARVDAVNENGFRESCSSNYFKTENESRASEGADPAAFLRY